ncbi:TetR family transcriptional regulator [Bacillus cereus]|nr:TetR family transcriptional regulator [Bacillus cereus]PGM61816.1 TetR family transcriptional regulator [Bacillus cereus]
MKNLKLTNRQEQAIKTRNELYRVMLKLMKEKQLEHISIEEISKKVGVSVGTFYHYFKSKEDIHIKLFEQIEEKAVLHLQNLKNKKEILQFFIQSSTFISQLDLHLNHFTHMNNKVFTQQSPSLIRGQLKTIIKKGQKNKKLINTMDVEELTDYLFIMAKGILFDWCIHHGKHSLESVMHKYMNQILHSITQ